MLEKKEISVFFSLLRAGLWNRTFDREDCLPLSAKEWEVIYKYGVQHTIEGILFDGLQHLGQAFQPPKPLWIKWMVRVEKIRQRNHWMDTIIAEQQSFFCQNGLNPILLKGQGVARCYPDPDRRISGDIDWYFEQTLEYNQATLLLKNKGLHFTLSTADSVMYDWNGSTVDQHARLFDIHNPFVKKYLQQLETTQKDFRTSLSIGTVDVTLLAPLLQIVQVNIHILKHLLSFGVGIRQLCDAARLYSYYKNQIDPLLLKTIYHKLSISRWIELLHQLLVNFLGLPKEQLPFQIERDQRADWMMEEILRTGNFGFYDTAYVRSENGEFITRRHSYLKIWNNFWKYLPYAPMETISFPIVHFFTRKIRC